jgi:hypothetical protein
MIDELSYRIQSKHQIVLILYELSWLLLNAGEFQAYSRNDNHSFHPWSASRHQPRDCAARPSTRHTPDTPRIHGPNTWAKDSVHSDWTHEVF